MIRQDNARTKTAAVCYDESGKLKSFRESYFEGLKEDEEEMTANQTYNVRIHWHNVGIHQADFQFAEGSGKDRSTRPHRTKQMPLDATKITTGAIDEKSHPTLQSKRENVGTCSNWPTLLFFKLMDNLPFS